MTESSRAERIRAYWESRGYRVGLVIVSDHGNPAVRSDLVNGLPRGYRDLTKAEIGVRAA